jgi:hypothetical protein
MPVILGAGSPAQTLPAGAPRPTPENPVNPVPPRWSRADNRGVHHGHDREGVER